MIRITSRPYRILADHMDIYQFMLDIYERDWRNGVPAPFLEYALSSEWMDKSLTHRNRIWLDGERIVAFCFYENPATDIYFSLRPGYEPLAGEMVAYADANLPRPGGTRRFVLFGGQDALMAAAAEAGYAQTDSRVDMLYDFSRELYCPLPKGYRFVEPGKLDVAKVQKCCWRGFDHEIEEGPWHGDAEGGYHLYAAPHATPQYPVAIKDARGEYVCFAGMWWTPQNALAYLEPLCTVPECRRKGLAAAALSELYRRLKPLGATHMTGGDSPFYARIGYRPAVTRTLWEKAPQPRS